MDNGYPQLSSTVNVTVRVGDLNDNAPKFNDTQRTAEISENLLGRQVTYFCFSWWFLIINVKSLIFGGRRSLQAVFIISFIIIIIILWYEHSRKLKSSTNNIFTAKDFT